MGRKVLKFLGYSTFFWTFFWLFAYLSFPYERVRDRIVQEVEFPKDARGNRRPSGYQLEIMELSPSWFTGVEARGVRIIKPGEGEEPTVDVLIEEVNARISLLSLLTGTIAVSFDARLAGGAVEGEVEYGDSSALQLNIVEPLRLRGISIIRAFLGLPLGGTLSGDIDVDFPEEIAQASGHVNLRADNLTIGDGIAKLRLPGMPNGITLERINAGRMTIRLAIAGGVATVQRLRSRGEDAELDGEGTINLMQPLRQSRLDLLVRLKILDAYREQSDRARAMISLLDSVPTLARARTSDGALQYRLGGSMGGGIRSSAAGSTRMNIAPDDEDDVPVAAPAAPAAAPPAATGTGAPTAVPAPAATGTGAPAPEATP
ncbi:MAG: type II secretion system protein GspN [Myxococcales bacterium]|nr:type II secretion system protein GspN [Myxococcales bacterium]MCB9628030.1 type II secretion system protein GspN [Sandaracinaceae bacterium]